MISRSDKYTHLVMIDKHIITISSVFRLGNWQIMMKTSTLIYRNQLKNYTVFTYGNTFKATIFLSVNSKHATSTCTPNDLFDDQVIWIQFIEWNKKKKNIGCKIIWIFNQSCFPMLFFKYDICMYWAKWN